MDIDLLSKMVKELILDQDRVILPGLGSFVAEIVPSTFSDKGYTINPPYRRLYFRAKPDTGDDLVKFYASSNNVKPEMAERIIVDFISELKSVLYEKKTVVFPGLGRLRATKENHLFFVADESLDIYPEGFGLEPISLKTHHETPEQVTAVVEDLKSFITVPESEPQEDPVVISQPVSEPVEDVKEEPVAEQVAEQVAEPVAEVVPEQISVPASKKDRKLLWICVAVLSFITLVLLGLAVLGRVFPDVVDPLLYSPEDLQIVRML